MHDIITLFTENVRTPCRPQMAQHAHTKEIATRVGKNGQKLCDDVKCDILFSLLKLLISTT